MFFLEKKPSTSIWVQTQKKVFCLIFSQFSWFVFLFLAFWHNKCLKAAPKHWSQYTTTLFIFIWISFQAATLVECVLILSMTLICISLFQVPDDMKWPDYHEYMLRKGHLIGMVAVGSACRGMLDFVEDCGLDVKTQYWRNW